MLYYICYWLCSLQKTYRLKMLYISFVNARNKEHTFFKMRMLCSVFLFFKIIIKKNNGWKIIILFYQKKSRFYLELDLKVQTAKYGIKEKQSFRIYNS